MDSLWGETFNIENIQEKTKEIINKTSKKKASKNVSSLDINKAVKSKTIDINTKLELIKPKVLSILGKQVDNVKTIYDKNELHEYLKKGLNFGRISIDTETNNSLDPLTCKLMGLCLYVKGEKQVYIPVNHVDKDTKERLSNQLTEQDIHDELQWLIDNKGNCQFIFHNGKFDIKVLWCTCNVWVPIDWDTMAGARMYDENEPSAGLKQQYIDKIDPEQSKYDIENLFEHLSYEIVDPELFALYSATDAMMTDKLYEWQINAFKDPNLQGVLNVLETIEIPIIPVVAKMELRGISMDDAYSERLSKKYHKLSEECNKKVTEELAKYTDKIAKWKLTPEANEKPRKEKIGKDGNEFGKSKAEKLSDPINVESPTQLSILLYDILKCPQVSLKQPRGTGVEQLTALAGKNKWPICNLLLEKRTIDKLLNTFIDALPEYKSPKDGKVHCEFLSLGTDSGRFSSKNPNLQQIPRANIEVKSMFRAPKGYSFVACDMSACEVRTSANAAYLWTGEHKMIDAYRSYDYEKEFKESIELYSYEKLNTKNGYKTLYILSTNDILLDEDNNEVKIIDKQAEGDKEKLILGDNNFHKFKVNKPGQDLYSLIASKAYNNRYEDNLEFYPEGTKVMLEGKEVIAGDRDLLNKSGKVRRQDAKSILIGMIYGRGNSSIKDQINDSREAKHQPLVTKEEVDNLIEGIYKSFPELKTWMDMTHDFVHTHGYIDDAFGRRRRLPDGMLPHYTVEELDNESNFNPLLECEDRKNSPKVEYYKQQLEKVKWKKEYDDLKQVAFKDGVKIEDNQGYIAQAERQAVNMQSQAAGSEINKKSMITIDKDPRLKELGFELLLTVHDEVIGQCPSENAEEVAKIIPEIMVTVGKDKIKCPMKSDASIFQAWYEDDMNAAMNEHYTDMLKEGISSEDAINKLVEEHTELPAENIRNFLTGKAHSMWDNLSY